MSMFCDNYSRKLMLIRDLSLAANVIDQLSCTADVIVSTSTFSTMWTRRPFRRTFLLSWIRSKRSIISICSSRG